MATPVPDGGSEELNMEAPPGIAVEEERDDNRQTELTELKEALGKLQRMMIEKDKEIDDLKQKMKNIEKQKDITEMKDVGFREVDEGVAVGVRGRCVEYPDLLAVEVEGHGFVEGDERPRSCGSLREEAAVSSREP